MPIYKLKTKKDGKQGYRVVVNYTDKNGQKKRKTKCVYGLKEAQDYESSARKDVKNEPEKVMTVQALYDEFVKVKAQEIRRTSLAKTKSILANHVLNTFLPSVKLSRLSKSVLQKWKDIIAEKDIMISTKNNAYRELNSLLNYAVKMDYLPKNPLSQVGRFKEPYFTVAEEKIHYYTKEQFEKYIQVAKDNQKTFTDRACYVFFILAFYTGMRKGEINALKWSDLENDVIHVRRSISQKNGYEESPPKNESSYRSLRIPMVVLNILNEHRAATMKNFQYSENLRICGAIKPIPDTTLENRNQFYAEKAGLPHIKIHDFRHSHATFLINSGVNILEVSHRLGHSDIKTTLNIYAHLYPSTEEAALKALNG